MARGPDWAAGAISKLHKEVPTRVSLKDPSLLRQAALIGGTWIEADGKGIAVTNPSTGAVIGHVPSLGAPETEAAIEAARLAQPIWAARTAKDRSQVLRRWYDLMMANQDDLGRILTAEQGKPLAEAKGEIDRKSVV